MRNFQERRDIMHTKRFFTFEGGEGAGKTTLIAELERRLDRLGYQVVVTREPGGIDIAEQIRRIILDHRNTSMEARTEALLYAAARRQHLVEKIVPALQSDCIVLCDRFVDSSMAYQGYARGLGIEEVFEINRFAIESWMPARTFYLDVDPRIGLGRVRADRGREVNRLDLESLHFHERVREGYLELTERFKDRIVKINADRSADAVLQEVWGILEQEIRPGRNL
jgi:dTMP kinase